MFQFNLKFSFNSSVNSCKFNVNQVVVIIFNSIFLFGNSYSHCVLLKKKRETERRRICKFSYGLMETKSLSIYHNKCISIVRNYVAYLFNDRSRFFNHRKINKSSINNHVYLMIYACAFLCVLFRLSAFII